MCHRYPGICRRGDARGDPRNFHKWDAIGTEFGGRHELYERNYAGNYENLRIETLGAATVTGDLESMQSLVKDCMSEYDLSGWTGSDLINPDDISLVGRGTVQAA